MNTGIKSEMLSISKIFEKWFRIPNYQRHYVWRKDQVTDLLDDISEACFRNKDGEYFLGSLVLRENRSNIVEYEVLDGQQRLTTLFLITAVIRDLAENQQRKETCQKSIYQLANSDDNIPERSHIIFDIRDDVKEFVNKYVKNQDSTKSLDEEFIKNSKINDTSVQNMVNAILTIREYFVEKQNIDEFFPFLRTKVKLFYVSTESLDDAFKLFTVLNNRGMKLRSADILKADNLSLVPKENQDSYAKKWEEIESYFGEDFDEFLSHLQSILVQEKARLTLLEEFEKNIFQSKKLDKGISFFDFVEDYKKSYQDLFDNMENKEVGNLLELMKRGFESNIWIAPLLKYFNKFKTENLLEFMKKLNNKFSSDWISRLTPTNRLNNMNSIIKKINTVQFSDDLLNDSIFEIDEKEIKTFVNGDVYGKRPARYILLRLNYLYSNTTDHNLNFPETISIEHILPRNPSGSSQWLVDFGSEEREEWTNKLGNLIIISRKKNSSQSNLDFVMKKEKYFKNKVELGRSVAIMTKNSWALGDLQENHQETVNKLLESYGITLNNT